MMLQNYTYVDPVMDPVVLLTLLLGLVFLTAAVVVYFTIRSLPLPPPTSAGSTSVGSAQNVPTAFVPPEADRVVLTPSAPVHTRWAHADEAASRTDRRTDRTDRRPEHPRRTHTPQHASVDAAR